MAAVNVAVGHVERVVAMGCASWLLCVEVGVAVHVCGVGGFWVECNVGGLLHMLSYLVIVCVTRVVEIVLRFHVYLGYRDYDVAVVRRLQ
jgi:hypothetical protein